MSASVTQLPSSWTRPAGLGPCVSAGGRRSFTVFLCLDPFSSDASISPDGRRLLCLLLAGLAIATDILRQVSCSGDRGEFVYAMNMQSGTRPEPPYPSLR